MVKKADIRASGNGIPEKPIQSAVKPTQKAKASVGNTSGVIPTPGKSPKTTKVTKETTTETRQNPSKVSDSRVKEPAGIKVRKRNPSKTNSSGRRSPKKITPKPQDTNGSISKSRGLSKKQRNLGGVTVLGVVAVGALGWWASGPSRVPVYAPPVASPSSAPVVSGGAVDGARNTETVKPMDENAKVGVPLELGGKGGGTRDIEIAVKGEYSAKNPDSAVQLNSIVWGSNTDSPPLTLDYLNKQYDFRIKSGLDSVVVENESFEAQLPTPFVTKGTDKKYYAVIDFYNTHKYGVENLKLNVSIKSASGVSINKPVTLAGIPTNFSKYILIEISPKDYTALSKQKKTDVSLAISGTYDLPTGTLKYTVSPWIVPLTK